MVLCIRHLFHAYCQSHTPIDPLYKQGRQTDGCTTQNAILLGQSQVHQLLLKHNPTQIARTISKT